MDSKLEPLLKRPRIDTSSTSSSEKEQTKNDEKNPVLENTTTTNNSDEVSKIPDEIKLTKNTNLIRKKSNLLDRVKDLQQPKKTKSSLQQSKESWSKFVDKAGIRDDLQYANKNGYFEDLDFLTRSEQQRRDAMLAQKKEQPSGSKRKL